MRYHLAAHVGKEQGKGQVQQREYQGCMVQYSQYTRTGQSYSSTPSSIAPAGGIIPQEDGKRRRSQAEGLPAWLPAGWSQPVCLGLSSGINGDPPELHRWASGDPIAIHRFKRAGRREGDRRVGKQEAWQAEVKALFG